MARAIIDPVTRIEGHLRVECEVDGGVVKDAWVSGTLYRGMETVLQGREPADAYYVAQRICGVCPIPHGHASTMATESALGIKIPNNARIIRNIIEGAETLHSHILWFYTLTALDYVDVVSALSANIADTYALAALFYEILCGAPPFEGSASAESEAIMAGFQKLVGEGGPDEAQVSLLRNSDPNLAHPASWAGFVSIGGLDFHRPLQ